MADDPNMWVEQPGRPQDTSSDGSGTIMQDYLAPLGEGRIIAGRNGYTEGMQSLIGNETYELAQIKTRPEEEAFDRVTLVWNSVHGAASPSASIKRHKANDEEWRARVTIKAMSAQDALDKGYLESGSGISGDLDLTTVYIPVPTLERKRWIRGVKNDRALPKSSAQALTKYVPILADAGQLLAAGSPFHCSDITIDSEGALLVVSYTYEWQPAGYVAPKAIS